MTEAAVFPSNEYTTAYSAPLPSEAQCPSARISFFFVLLLTLVIYVRPEDMYPPLGQLHLTFMLGLCAGLTFFGSCLLGNARLIWTRELQIVLLLTGCFIAGVPFAYWKSGSFRVLTEVWLRTFVVFFLLTQTLLTLGRIRKILWAIILSELIATSFSILNPSKVMWVGDRMWGANRGIFEWNYLGVAAAITIPYMAAFFATQRSFLKTGLLAATFLSTTWMLVLTASRSSFLDVTLSIGLTLFLVLRGSSRAKLVGAGLTLSLIVAICMAPSVFWQRLETLHTSSDTAVNADMASAEASEEGRMAGLTRSLNYTLQHPIFGLGLGNFAIASGTDVGPEGWYDTHNTFTQVSSEAGVPALILFIGLLILATRNIRRVTEALPQGADHVEPNLMARATLCSLLSFGFGAFFANLAYEYYFFYLVAIGLGIQHIARARRGTSPAPVQDCAYSSL